MIKSLEYLLTFRLGESFVGLWLMVIVFIVLSYVLVRTAVQFIRNQLHVSPFASHWGLTRFLIALMDSTTRWFLLIVCIYFNSFFLEFSPKQMHALNAIVTVTLFLQIAFWVSSIVNYKLEQLIASKKDLEDQQQFSTVAAPLKYSRLFVLWSLILLLALENFGINVTALITGFWIGGVAVALAVQNTLGDLMAT